MALLSKTQFRPYMYLHVSRDFHQLEFASKLKREKAIFQELFHHNLTLCVGFIRETIFSCEGLNMQEGGFQNFVIYNYTYIFLRISPPKETEIHVQIKYI